MNFVVSLVQLFFAALLHLTAVKCAHIPKEGVKGKNEVVPFMEVYNKSMCRTRETLVDIMKEYPDDTEYTYHPACVVLMRCAGCCPDEALECVPTDTRNVTLEVIRTRQRVSQHGYQLTFTEHTRCECKPKQEVKVKKENHCGPCSERRKRLYVQDPITCKCSCKFTQLQCKSRQLELNERTCRCDKPRR
ncbi:vascular endothelial growth factor A-A isoform X2 [Alosa pseudoharengus]|uniref:vascular endothelial growth factor A-A isoform X1 n=1 Tax=Alosa sapidissima TaxID=34773 RepID=UPI001C098245|nr:vascular endothelial growth factor A-A isoform X1 [Alosa sapidissima]XP_048116730.1 vascular endothelial growth factor A-A isoform X2 [Alosa alosa]